MVKCVKITVSAGDFLVAYMYIWYHYQINGQGEQIAQGRTDQSAKVLVRCPASRRRLAISGEIQYVCARRLLFDVISSFSSSVWSTKPGLNKQFSAVILDLNDEISLRSLLRRSLFSKGVILINVFTCHKISWPTHTKR